VVEHVVKELHVKLLKDHGDDPFTENARQENFVNGLVVFI